MINKLNFKKANIEKIYFSFIEKNNEIQKLGHYKTVVLISSQRTEEFRRLQQLLCKAINFFVKHYFEFEHVMPLDEKAKEIIRLCEKHPYHIGTYRPDFLIDEDNQLKICEINARFPLNGYFGAVISESIANEYLLSHEKFNNTAIFSNIISHLFIHFEKKDRIYILKGNDIPGDLGYYTDIFEMLGFGCEIVYTDEIDKNINSFSDAVIINEFSQLEYLNLKMGTIDKLISYKSLNDFRTIFLIHDKRFLSVLSNEAFLRQVFNAEEVFFMLDHIIPTNAYENNDHWKNALVQKNKWVLKHRLLGKSDMVFAGCNTGDEIWKSLFDKNEVSEMVLQPLINQKKFNFEKVGGSAEEYVVGTFMCMNNDFIGPGIFRSTNQIVTQPYNNVKLPFKLMNEKKEFENCFAL
jgi:hypothetical protein